MVSPLTIRILTTKDDLHMIPYLAGIHGSCVMSDRIIGGFLQPLNQPKLLAWWRTRVMDADDGRHLIVMLADESKVEKNFKGKEVVGVALLALPESETSPFRGFVEFLGVKPDSRRRGGAKAMMDALHAHALGRGVTLLTAEVESGSVGETIFKKFGYNEAGRVPNYAISPADLKKKDAIILYKETI